MSKIYEALQLARGERAKALADEHADQEHAAPGAIGAENAGMAPDPGPSARIAERRVDRLIERPAPPAPRGDAAPGILPDLPPGLLRRSGFDLDREMSRLAAALNAVERPEGEGIVIHIAAVQAGEGASTLARELATHLADHSRRPILLVDGDDDGRAQARWFGLAASEGIADRHLDGRPIEPAFAPIGNSPLHVGLLADDPAAITSATERQSMAALYTHFRRNFAVTIVDCPPLADAPDMVALSRHADGVVLLVEAGRTRGPVVSRARDMIADAGGRVLGVALNKRRDYIPDFIYRLL